MSQNDLQDHWQKVYSGKSETELTWFEDKPETSLSLIAQCAKPSDRIIDVGGGASRLADELLILGFSDVSVLDVSEQALLQSQQRLGKRAKDVHWLVADITKWQPSRKYTLWHDRAVFHFLTQENQRQAYIDVLSQAVAPNGTVIIATFALDGPEKCSGLEVVRYSPKTLDAVLGNNFKLIESKQQHHQTPKGGTQFFQYSKFIKQT